MYSRWWKGSRDSRHGDKIEQIVFAVTGWSEPQEQETVPHSETRMNARGWCGRKEAKGKKVGWEDFAGSRAGVVGKE